MKNTYNGKYLIQHVGSEKKTRKRNELTPEVPSDPSASAVKLIAWQDHQEFAGLPDPALHEFSQLRGHFVPSRTSCILLKLPNCVG